VPGGQRQLARWLIGAQSALAPQAPAQADTQRRATQASAAPQALSDVHSADGTAKKIFINIEIVSEIIAT
jgi:hypothetical protein